MSIIYLGAAQRHGTTIFWEPKTYTLILHTNTHTHTHHTGWMETHAHTHTGWMETWSLGIKLHHRQLPGNLTSVWMAASTNWTALLCCIYLEGRMFHLTHFLISISWPLNLHTSQGSVYWRQVWRRCRVYVPENSLTLNSWLTIYTPSTCFRHMCSYACALLLCHDPSWTDSRQISILAHTHLTNYLPHPLHRSPVTPTSNFKLLYIVHYFIS